MRLTYFSFLFGYALTILPAGYYSQKCNLSFVSGVAVIAIASISFIIPFIASYSKILIYLFYFLNGIACVCRTAVEAIFAKCILIEFLQFCLFLVIFLQAILHPMVFKLIANWSIPNERTFYMASYNIGFMLLHTISAVFIISSTTNGLSSWKIHYFINTIIMSIGAQLFLRNVYDSPSTHPRIKSLERTLIERELFNEVYYTKVSID